MADPTNIKDARKQRTAHQKRAQAERLAAEATNPDGVWHVFFNLGNDH